MRTFDALRAINHRPPIWPGGGEIVPSKPSQLTFSGKWGMYPPAGRAIAEVDAGSTVDARADDVLEALGL